MFCIYCGGPVDREKMACRDCGKAVGSLVGGNSFQLAMEALSGNGETVRSQTCGSDRVREEVGALRRQMLTLRDKRVFPMLLLCSLLSLLAVLCSAVLLVNTAAIRRQVESEPEAPKNDTGAPVITIQPQDCMASMLGLTTASFRIEATGDGLQFTWEKYDPEKKEWNVISADDERFEITSEENKSVLRMTGEDPDYTGTYICCIRDADGAEVLFSRPVILSNIFSDSQPTAAPVGGNDDG